MRFGFKIHLDDISEKLLEKDLTNKVLEILQSEYDFFTSLQEEMQKIEDSGIVPRSKTEYDESIGEF